MPALNRVQLIGRLGKDPESKYTPAGKKVTHFSLAISQRWEVSGESKEYTECVNIEAADRLGEVGQEYLKKGSRSIWKEGSRRTSMKTRKVSRGTLPRWLLWACNSLTRRIRKNLSSPSRRMPQIMKHSPSGPLHTIE